MYQFVAVLDVQGTLLEVNRAALEGGGLTLADVEGKPFWQCFWWGVSTEIQDDAQGDDRAAAREASSSATTSRSTGAPAARKPSSSTSR